MSELPKGWVETTIGELILNMVGGASPKKENYVPYGTLALNKGDIKENGVIKVKSQANYLPQDFVEKHSSKKISKGAVLVTLRDLSQKADFLGLISSYHGSDEALITQGMYALTTSECVIKDLLVLYSNTVFYRLYVKRQKIGATQVHLRNEQFLNIPFPLAPLTEQKRIVEKLDQVLAQVDTIKARLDGIPAILKRFRQSVLAAAVSGKLTEEWRENSIFIKHDLSEQWKWKDIPESWSVSYYSELVESRLGKMLDKAKNTGLATKYLGNINVRWLHVDLTNTQKILVSEQERQDLSLQKGDVLICEGGEPGRCAIWASSEEQSIIFQKALHRARVKSKIIPEWLVYNLKNDADSLFLNQLFTGTTIKHLTGKALKNYPLRVPSLEEQTEIVRLVDQYFAFADTIEKQVQKAQQRVDKLTQSILAKAFRGELVPQNPTDEPADELLKRIATAHAEAEALALSAKKTAKKVGKKIAGKTTKTLQ